MKNLITKGVSVLLLLLTIQIAATSQDDAGIQSLNEGDISEKFDFLYEKSNNYRDFKVVKKGSLTNLKSQVVDSIQGLKEKQNSLNVKIENQNDKISRLENTINDLNSSVSAANENVESISYLGMDFTKAALKTILSFIILGLLAALVFMYFQYKNSNYVTVKAEDSLAKIQSDYDDFKKRTLEKEQVMKREIMDLRNEL